MHAFFVVVKQERKGEALRCLDRLGRNGILRRVS